MSSACPEAAAVVPSSLPPLPPLLLLLPPFAPPPPPLMYTATHTQSRCFPASGCDACCVAHPRLVLKPLPAAVAAPIAAPAAVAFCPSHPLCPLPYQASFQTIRALASMTFVPKHVQFLRPLYASFQALYERWLEKTSMTYSDTQPL
ncbi:hypothetical protein B0H14DRAFT_3499347 [Mycena olivaceomarginata]|nr:hypothetical protein B0H14DRAFT_3499347 [Mycena olivaceomarginata]